MTIVDGQSASAISGSSVARIFLFVAAISSVAIYSRLHVFLPDGVRQFSLVALVGVSVIGIVLCAVERMLIPGAFSLAIISYALANLYVFSTRFGVPINLNAGLASAPLFLVAAFYWAIGRTGLKRAMDMLFLVSVGYGVVYIALSGILGVSPSALSSDFYRNLVLGDGADIRVEGRSDRVFGYLALLGFGLLTSIVNLRRSITLWRLATFALFSACVAMTGSRAYIASLVVVSVLYVILKAPSRIFSLASGVLTFSVLVFAYCLVFDQNPFVFFQYDGSGAARLRSFETAAYWISRFPVLGAGTAPSAEIEAYYVVGQAFSLTDLGAAGILYAHGLVGLALWLLVPLVLRPRPQAITLENVALNLTMAVLLLHQVLAPALWYGGGTLFFALWIAHRLAQRSGLAKP